MNYNKTIKALERTFVEDGMGGGSYQEIVLKDDIKCAIAPIRESIIDAGGREQTHTLIKVFTKNPIPKDNTVYEYQGVRYKIAYWVDYGKVYMYGLEEV